MPWDAERHLREELVRLARSLSELISPRADRDARDSPLILNGLVVDEREVDQLLLELAGDWGRETAPTDTKSSRAREDIAARAHAAARDGSPMPLLEVAKAFGLEPAEYDAVLLALAVELDVRFARIVGFLNDHAARQRPTLGLVARLHRLESTRPPDPVSLLNRPVIRDGLLVLEGEGPLSSQALRIAPALVDYLAHGRPRRPFSARVQRIAPRPDALRGLVLDAESASRSSEVVESLRRGQKDRFVLLVGSPGEGRATLAGAVSSEAGLTLVQAELRAADWVDVARVCRLEVRMGGRCMLLLRCDEPLPWDDVWVACAGLGCPLAAAVQPSAVDAVLRQAPSPPLVLTMRQHSLADRVRLWKALLPTQHAIQDLEAIAARFPFPPRGIARSISRAVADAALAPPEARRLDDEAVSRACRAVGETMMGRNAQKLPLPFTRKDLIVPQRVSAELDLALAWVKHGRRVLDDWGFAARLVFGRGLTALFAGPPGTGKTMAAQVLARELGVDAYRVDLSQVMSKYIGETEKNLASVFDEAKASGAVLLFDEAEALFGKRSEVSDAHDRYANVEIAFLLQRMEEHPGVTVLSTNRLRDLDEAFVRRFHLIVDFPVPEEGERARIWQGMLPSACPRASDVDCNALAREFEMTGGEIKNAALAAAFMAASDGVAVANEHLRAAVRREIAKSGKVLADPS